MTESGMDFRGVIDALGSQRLRELMGVTRAHIYQMRFRNSIAAEYWAVIADEAQAQGKTALDLAALQKMWVARWPRGRNGGNSQALS